MIAQSSYSCPHQSLIICSIISITKQCCIRIEERNGPPCAYIYNATVDMNYFITTIQVGIHSVYSTCLHIKLITRIHLGRATRIYTLINRKSVDKLYYVVVEK